MGAYANRSRRFAVLLSQAEKLGARAVQSRFHGAYRDADCFRDLSVIHVLQIAVDNLFAEFRLKHQKYRLHKVSCFSRRQHPLWMVRRPGDQHSELPVLLAGLRNPILLRASIAVDQKIPCEPRQPGGKRSLRRAKCAKAAEHAEENLLRDILGRAVIARKAPGYPVNEPRMLAYQRLPGGFVSAQARFHYLFFRMHRHRRPRPPSCSDNSRGKHIFTHSFYSE